MKTTDTLGVFEQRVLTAVLQCGDEGYIRKVNEKVNELGGKKVQLAAIYVVLDRLERKGFVKAWRTDPVPESGGKPRWCYGILPAGENAMEEVSESSQRILEPWGFKWIKKRIK